MKLDKMKSDLLHAKELRAKARGRLDQLLDNLQKEFGVRSLVEARGLKLDLEKKRDQLKEVLAKRESELEKKVNDFFGKSEDPD